MTKRVVRIQVVSLTNVACAIVRKCQRSTDRPRLVIEIVPQAMKNPINQPAASRHYRPISPESSESECEDALLRILRMWWMTKGTSRQAVEFL